MFDGFGSQNMPENLHSRGCMLVTRFRILRIGWVTDGKDVDGSGILRIGQHVNAMGEEWVFEILKGKSL